APSLKPVIDNPEARFPSPPMSARDLRRALERPAGLGGLAFDDSRVAELVTEAAGAPTALPMLHLALLPLCAARDSNPISWDSYRTVGRPREALKRSADAIYQQLPQELDQQVARLIFHDLVQPAVGVEFVRRRVRREALRRLATTATVDLVLRR